MRTDFFNEALVMAMLTAASSAVAQTPQSVPDDERPMEADTLRERLTTLMDQGGKIAVQAGMPGDLITVSDFAACAFIDEVLLSSSSWRGRLEWLKKPLQFTRHGTATAGEDFYRLLDDLLEKAGKKTSAAIMPEAQTADAMSAAQEIGPRDPLHAVLEIFALCLAQGFTGMLYDNPHGIRDRLERIGRFIPAVARRSEPFFLAPLEKMEKQEPLRKAADLARRFDLLDVALWIVPPLLTLLLYRMYQARLDQFLQPFLQGSVSL